MHSMGEDVVTRAREKLHDPLDWDDVGQLEIQGVGLECIGETDA
jgi:hypothetical protein